MPRRICSKSLVHNSRLAWRRRIREPIWPNSAALGPFRVTPAFKRRAFISDIMTWDYNFPDRLELHLATTAEFTPWMARRGINAFSYIRHAHDTRLNIDEVAPLLRGARNRRRVRRPRPANSPAARPLR